MPSYVARVLTWHNTFKTSTNTNRAWVEGFTCDRTVQRWFQKFHTGDESLECRGQACSLDNKQLQAIVEKNYLQSVGEMSKKVSISNATVLSF